MWIWFVIAGLASGIIAGMGMGGGTLLIPVLGLLLNVEQKLSQSINLIVFIPTAIVALIIHYRNKLVATKVGLTIVASGVVFSLFGAYLATLLTNNQLRKYFGFFLLFVGLFQLFDTLQELMSHSKLPSNVLIKSKMQKFFVKK